MIILFVLIASQMTLKKNVRFVEILLTRIPEFAGSVGKWSNPRWAGIRPSPAQDFIRNGVLTQNCTCERMRSLEHDLVANALSKLSRTGYKFEVAQLCSSPLPNLSPEKTMIVKKLIRKQPVSFTVVPMVKRFSHPLQERASFIKNELERGSNYQTAIRAFDSKGKAK